MYNFGMSNAKYFKVLSSLAIILITIAISCTTEFKTSFAQNLVKTTGAVYICLGMIYTFILLYRFSLKKNLILTLKEVLLSVVFITGIYNLALLTDIVLVLTSRDLDAMPSNVITYSIIVLFLILQKLTLTESEL